MRKTVSRREVIKGAACSLAAVPLVRFTRTVAPRQQQPPTQAPNKEGITPKLVSSWERT